MSIYTALLRSVVADAVQTLLDFASGPLFAEKFTLAFETPAPSLVDFRSALAQLPEIEVLPDEVLQGAAGAFSAQTGKIYLSESLVNGDVGRLRAALLEEIGHYLDSVFNAEDATGDEGAIFAALVLGESLSDEVLGQLQAENDTGVIIIDGQSVAVEMANFTGTAGDDTIVGTVGNDVIDGLGGNDIINGGFGYDTVDGGAGNDLLIIDYSNSVYFINTARLLTAPLVSNGSGGFNGYYGRYTLDSFTIAHDQVNFSNIERFQITGTPLNDNITTASGNDTINGGDGDDYLDSGAGDDTVNGGTGGDNILGQDGNDSLVGGDGNDTIDGGAGNDTIEGGAGNDTITQGSGVNIVDGGDGSDTLVDGNFSSLTNNQIFNDSGTTYPTITLADGTTISNIEYFTNLTTGSGNDTISYNLPLNNNLNTGSGDDTINGGFGYDTVDGGAGNDLLIIDYSNSVYFINTARLLTAPLVSNGSGGFNGYYGRYTLDSFTIAHDQVNFSNIERFQITGTPLNDNIGTTSGNDTINGGDGDDYLDSGAGNDTVNGGTGGDNILGQDGNDNLVGGDGNDTIDGGAGNDTIEGGTGNDTITQGNGVNIVDGGDGSDTLVDGNFSSLTNNQIFNDSGTTYPTITLADGTTISNIEYFTNLTTGSGNDTISYNLPLNNNLNTGSGDDTINGGFGYDTVDGGAGNDLLIIDYSNSVYFINTARLLTAPLGGVII